MERDNSCVTGMEKADVIKMWYSKKISTEAVLEILGLETRKQLVDAASKLRNKGIDIPYMVDVQEDPRTYTMPKILLFDIETTPMLAFTWKLGKTILSHENVVEDWHMITWSAKWLFSNKIYSDVITRKEMLSHDDKRICEGLWDLIEQADIVIGHNSDNFDIPKMNTRFLKHGMKRPSPYISIDTCKIARNAMAFANNRLDNICRELGEKGKTSTSYSLWVKCFNGDENALKEMLSYNEGDVEILENVYVALRPWMRSHPNVTLYDESDGERCTVCGESNLSSVGDYFTGSGRFTSYRCDDCGAPSRARSSKITKKTHPSSLRSTAR